MIAIDKHGNPITTKKALAISLLALMQLNGEASPLTIQNSAKGVALTGRTLTHRFALNNAQSGLQDLLQANTNRVLGITDFDKKKAFEGGLHLITHMAIATTEALASKDDSSLAVANFIRRMKTDDAFLQASTLRIKIEGSNQPDLLVRIGDVMISQADNATGEFAMELPQGFYLTNEQSLSLTLETPSGANLGIPNEKYKGIEFTFHGMRADV